MAIRTTGPVSRVHTIGNIRFWNLQAFNNTSGRIAVTFRVINLSDLMNVEIGSITKNIEPGFRQSFTIDIDDSEYTMAIVEYPTCRNEVLVTVAGLDSSGRQIPGATYRHTELIDVESVRTSLKGKMQNMEDSD